MKRDEDDDHRLVETYRLGQVWKVFGTILVLVTGRRDQEADDDRLECVVLDDDSDVWSPWSPGETMLFGFGDDDLAAHSERIA